MAGYFNYSKSNNAVAAEAAGRYPLTIATKVLAKMAGVTQKVAREALEETWGGEWHHSSKKYNCVNYYDVVDGGVWLVEQGLTDSQELVAEFTRRFEAEVAPLQKSYYKEERANERQRAILAARFNEVFASHPDIVAALAAEEAKKAAHAAETAWMNDPRTGNRYGAGTSCRIKWGHPRYRHLTPYAG